MELLEQIDALVWGPAMIALLLGAHLYLTFKTRFIQRKLPLAIKMSLKGDDAGGEGDITHFGALATALAATVGTGSIVGVATAVLAGGPGAIFWMWITGIFGIATKYSEVFISIKYRVRDSKGAMLGGAMYAWERAFRKNGRTPIAARGFAIAFAAFAALAALGIGNAVQSNAITGIVTTHLGAPGYLVGLVVAALGAIVIIGGVQSIARVCELLVPFMAVGYALGCIAILVANGAFILPAFELIITSAFTGQAAFGGAVGSGVMVALQYGCARGLFSNESGLGSAPLIAAAAQTKNPAQQSLVAMTGAFWSTVVICLLTGVVIVSTLLAYPDLAGVIANTPNITGTQLANLAFEKIPFIGAPILALGIIAFSFSTIIGWYYYGNRAVAYLFGQKGILPYQVMYVIATFLGAVGVGNVVWTISDITNALMAIPNIIITLALAGMVARETKHYVYDGNLDEESSEAVPSLGDLR
ncbi:sodium:alanine symporter family protein [Eggerthellaceae bacterium zg-1084]|uniref:Sodium:alanine symporter family protein n=1 Tax=Berryella wangjianweii TaxID=2734634 RepID=A0A6M8J1H7_9ACTN|nr:amino acid carrier protein [Berryella wangjianweii]NPD30748.1 sodium:alanine symporter family protein [Berryella wangjianweii]NPD32033.1 sodium:alanine symporter family protein [Eggerthellaceae bacterium zg-997]QKF07384.1 sodium:alanine symporter family protein [Berryella wangjianweii]